MNELEDALPNGFHDAEIFSIAIDYATREVKLEMALWVDYEDEVPGKSGRTPLMRRAFVTLRGLEYAVVPRPNGPPPKNLSVIENGQLDVIGYAGAPSASSDLPALPDGAFVYSFFVTNWNDSIVLAAREAELRWIDPAPVTTPAV